jgi:hypothetical protein
MGQKLEYKSLTNGRWIPCKVVVIEPNGSLQLDVKVGHSLGAEEQAAKLRLIEQPGQ